MGFKYSQPIRIISVIVLSFFLWTFGGLFDIAYAVKNSNQPPVVNNQSKTQKPEGKFQQDIDDIYTAISDTATDTDTKKAKVKAKKTEIDSLDVDINKQFAETEKKLKDAKLPDEIFQRHYKFVKHYKDNHKELKANLDAIDKAKDKAEADSAIGKAKAHLEKVKPPKKHKKLDPNKLPHRVPEIREFPTEEKKAEENSSGKSLTGHAWHTNTAAPILIASAGSLDGLLAQAASVTTTSTPALPTPADLSETVEVKLTPEIKAKAQELGNSPVKLYEFVRNSVTYEPYYGSLKGAQQTLMEMAGNDIDQASLLISLFRSANIPARYTCGTIELSLDRLMNWLGGVKNPNTAAQVMATNGVPGKLITEAGTIKYAQFDHCWVEAFVDMFPSMGFVNRKGTYWTPIDPSMKEMYVREGEDISKDVPFDEMAHLSNIDNTPPILTYYNALSDSYSTNQQGDLFTTLYGASPKWQEFGILPGTLPYKVLEASRYSEVPDLKRFKVSLGVSYAETYGETVSIEKTFAEIAGKKITISYSGASAEDITLIETYGGLLSTPAYLIRVKPEIKLNDEVLFSGPAMQLGGQVSLTVGITAPNLNKELATADLSHGIGFAIAVPALNYSARQTGDQSSVLAGLQGTLDDSIDSMDGGAGELLNNTAIAYFAQLDIMTRAIKSLMHIHNTRRPSIAVVSADVNYDYIFGVPVSPPRTGGLTIDAALVACSPIALDGDMNSRREFVKLIGINSSYLEHKLLENLLLKGEAISAVKALQTATQNGIPLYAIDGGNLAQRMPLLTVSDTVKENIRNAVNAGKEVIISRDNVSINNWTGVGYIVRDPLTGAGDYMITDSFKGGRWEYPAQCGNDNALCQVYLSASIGAVAALVAGEPKNGLLWPFERLLVWPFTVDSELDGIYTAVRWLDLNYSPRLYFDANKEDLKALVNMTNLWIFYYTGHGYFDNINGVPANEIDCKSCKIVFLNSCRSFSETLSDRFHIDQELIYGSKKLSRDEIFLGWDGDVSFDHGRYIAERFWRGLGTDEILSVKDILEILGNTADKNGATLKYNGCDETTLSMWGNNCGH